MGSDSPVTIIQIKVLPRSAKNQIVSYENNQFKIKLMAPPVDGQANRALISFLAEKCGIAKNRVEITAGQTSRNKKIKIYGLCLEEIILLLKK